MKTPLSVAEAIRSEAAECRKSSADNRNEPHNRDIFHLVSIVLDGIADKIDPQAKPSVNTAKITDPIWDSRNSDEPVELR